MPIVPSTRTPEGQPHRCPVCGELAALEPSYPGGDSTCPSCGHLLWWFRDRFGGEISLQSKLAGEIGADSIDIVELVMALEEEFDIAISDSEAEQIQTVEDLLRLIARRQKEMDER